MNALSLISSPLSETWTSWIMFALLVCIGVIHICQPTMIAQAFTTLVSKMGRTYGDLRINVPVSILVAVFRIGVAAITTQLFFYGGEAFVFTQFIYLLAVWALYDLAKVLVLWILQATFRFARQMAILYNSYANVWLVISLILFVCDLVIYNLPAQPWIQTLIMVLFGVTLLFAMIRWQRMFCTSLVSMVSVLLIFVTLEVIPVVGFASVCYFNSTNILELI